MLHEIKQITLSGEKVALNIISVERPRIQTFARTKEKLSDSRKHLIIP